ncbi:MAG: membrane protein insertase YidC [Planctomycetes bacterium]|nr:membrane protein insertase YidC [Planctomycetota bacterium]
MASKSTDWVKIVGLAFAIAALLGSHWYFSGQLAERNAEYQEKKKAYDEKVQADEEEAKKKAEAAKSLLPQKTGDAAKTGEVMTAVKSGEEKTGAKTGTGEESKTVVEAPLAQPPKEIAEAEPITIPGEHLEMTFGAKGAALKHAVLSDVYPVAKDLVPEQKPGVEILDEIEPGRLSLSMPSIRIGDTTYGDLESRVWELVEDSKGFQGEGQVWTVAYATTVCAKTEPYAPQARVTKRFMVPKGARHVEAEIQVQNLTKQTIVYDYTLRGAAGILLDGPPDNPRQGAYFNLKAQLAARPTGDDSPTVVYVDPHAAANADESKRNISRDENLWATVQNRFFIAALLSRDPTQAIKITADPIHKGMRKDKLADLRFQEDNIAVTMQRRESADLEAGKTSEPDRYAFYMGPAQESMLFEYEQALQLPKPVYLNSAVQYCEAFNWRWNNVDRLGRLLLWIFNGIHALTSNYGVAVILLTVIVKLALHPVQRKQTVSMFKLQEIQPQLKAIEEKYANQTSSEMKQKKELEKMDLMRKAGANPFTGCLPMFLQMPILFALYGAFSHAYEIRQAGFLWIKDLSLADHLADLPMWPGQLNLLPILYMGMTIAQSLLQPKPASSDPQQDQQRKMMMFMPVAFGFLFYRMPAGLLLYFAASATFGMIESWYIRKYILKKDSPGGASTTEGNKSPSGSPIPGVKAAAK